MTEARQQNTEIRLSIGKVGDKVDQLTSKVCTGFFTVQRAALVTFTIPSDTFLTDKRPAEAGQPVCGRVRHAHGDLRHPAQHPENGTGETSTAFLF